MQTAFVAYIEFVIPTTRAARMEESAVRRRNVLFRDSQGIERVLINYQ